MITPEYCRTMARYGTWQNTSLVAAADSLPPAALTQDRGAFFGSIMATFSHLLWGDKMWLSRFDAGEAPAGGIGDTPTFVTDWTTFKAMRAEQDVFTQSWADALGPEDLEADYSWFSPAAGRQIDTTKALCVAHMFNHGTHHRGQIHAMLTAAGARPDDTDLPFMPNL